uniref:Reverse transcriptase domain-containing protein n=1 Tax=Tanacetum cinerariifolium TaxID=118510 RepID=A0A699HVN8_TANCI|nr:reverse transcriptase domain-containing protein [Tanacetum cinerariifolium]
MSTRSTTSNLFSLLRDPESLIRRRNLGDPSSLFDFEEIMNIPHNNQGPHPAGPSPPNNNGPPPVQNGVSDDALRLSLFTYSLTHHATAWYDRLSRNSIHTFDDMMKKFLSKYVPPSMLTKLRNEIMKFRQDPNESLFEAWERYNLSIDRPEVAPKPKPTPLIPYPSRLNDQKLREKANNQMMKFLQIFQRLHFDISFADALLHMLKFASAFKSLLIDYDVDPRVPLILERPFLRTTQALIDVHGEELTLRVNDEAVIFKVEHTLRYSRSYNDESVNRIDIIDVACEEYAQEVLEFSNSSTSGNLTPSDPIIATYFPSFTPFEGSDFILEEI